MQQIDLLIQEIEGIDDYLGPTFRYLQIILQNFKLKRRSKCACSI